MYKATGDLINHRQRPVRLWRFATAGRVDPFGDAGGARLHSDTPLTRRQAHHDLITAICRCPPLRGGRAHRCRVWHRHRIDTSHHNTERGIGGTHHSHAADDDNRGAADNHRGAAASVLAAIDHRTSAAAGRGRACSARGGGTCASRGGSARAAAPQRPLPQLCCRQGRGRRTAAAGGARLQSRVGPRQGRHRLRIVRRSSYRCSATAAPAVGRAWRVGCNARRGGRDQLVGAIVSIGTRRGYRAAAEPSHTIPLPAAAPASIRVASRPGDERPLLLSREPILASSSGALGRWGAEAAAHVVEAAHVQDFAVAIL